MDLFFATAFACLVVAACVGWGRLIENLISRWGAGTPLPALSTGTAGCLGLAASLCAAGPFVAIGQYRPLLGWLWIVAGLALAGRRLLKLGAAKLLRPPLLSIAALAALGAQAVYRSGFAIGTPPWNICDDTVAYLSFVERLGQTGGLIEPFSQRRLGGLGGSTAFDSLFATALGINATFVAEVVAGGLLVGLLLLPLTPTLPRLLLGALMIASFTLWQNLRLNLSPTELAVALLAASILVIAETRRNRADLLDRRVLAMVGVLGAGLLTMRTPLAVPVALFGIALIARASGAGLADRLRATIFFGLAMGLPALPWMVALMRSSGTPLYPPFNGNFNASWPGYRDPAADLLAQLWGVLTYAEVAWMLAGVVVAGIALVLLRRREAWAEGPLLALPGVAVTVLLSVVSLSAFRSFDLARYSWPLIAGVLVAALSLLANEAAPQVRRRAGAVAVSIVVAIACVLAFPNDRVRREVDTTLTGLERGWNDEEPYEPGYVARPDYDAAQASLPSGAKVATASDYSYLLDYERNEIVNLDTLGVASPPPGMPLGGATEEMTAYLREQEIEFVVATDPQRSECYYRKGLWDDVLERGIDQFARMAPSFLAWINWLSKRSDQEPGLSHRFGKLIVLDLRGDA